MASNRYPSLRHCHPPPQTSRRGSRISGDRCPETFPFLLVHIQDPLYMSSIWFRKPAATQRNVWPCVCVCVSGTKIESPLCQAYFRTIFNFISSTREAFSNNPHPPPMNGLLSQMHFLIGYVSSVWRKWRAGNADRLHFNYMMFDQRRL